MCIEEIKKIYETMKLISFFNDIEKKGEFIQKIFNVYGKEVNIVTELLKMELWLDSNPAKNRKKNYKKFIINWLSRSQKPIIYRKEKKYNDGNHNDYKPRKQSAV